MTVRMSDKPRGGPVWTPMPCLTGNRGDRAQFDDIIRALERPPRRLRAETRHERFPWATLTEMHNVQGILDKLEREGFEVWRGNREDSEASVVVWDPEQVRVPRDARWTYPLIPAGKRGGKYNMAKSLNVVRGIHLESRRAVVQAAVHQLQTVSHPARDDAAERFVREVDRNLAHRRVLTMVSGDWNAIWTHEVMDPLFGGRGQWTCDPAWHKPVPTFDLRDIDYFAWKNHRQGPDKLDVIRVQDKGIIRINSDHLAKVVDFDIRRKR